MKALFDCIKHPFKRRLIVILMQIILIGIQFLMVEFSNRNSFVTDAKWYMILFNFITYAFIIFTLQLITQKIWIADLIATLLLFILSIVNYYVIIYHGMPLSYQEFANFKTAMNVVGNYSFQITMRVMAIIVLFFVGLGICLLLRQMERKMHTNLKKKWIANGCIVLAGVFFFVWGYVSDAGPREKMTINWSWTDQYRDCRVVPCFIESFVTGLSKLRAPEGYSEEKVTEIYEQTPVGPGTAIQYPDIILILNESFYDLNIVTNVETDKDYLENLNRIGNKITGYAVSPSIGGGTNSAEYELLTSNSLQLLGNITPFTTLNLNGAKSVVSVLKELGYVSLAAHPAPGSNYSRTIGYDALGFDEIYFIEDFDSIDYYYDRWYATDACVYRNICKWYEEMPETPRFLYALTFQNHGDWNQNDDKYDTVHVKNETGIETSVMNEYLTCMDMSVQALSDLISYYEQSNRPVVICMVGDHAPAFVDEAVDDDYSETEKNLLERSTPFMIWSNMFTESKDIGTISMIYLVPKLLEEAGLPLSGYYSYIASLQEDVPVLSSYGVCYDKDFNMFYYDETSPVSELVDNYFILEYDYLTN